MNLDDALTKIINFGVEAVRRDYANDERKRDGAILGFTECRGLSLAGISALHREADQKSNEARRDQAADYWYWRCRALEIEWVANVLSAILMNEGRPVIVQPTGRGFLMAARIVGVAA